MTFKNTKNLTENLNQQAPSSSPIDMNDIWDGVVKNNSKNKQDVWDLPTSNIRVPEIVSPYKAEDFSNLEGPLDIFQGDLEERRSKAQSTLGLIGKSLGQFGTEVVLGTPEAVGYMLDWDILADYDAAANEGFDNEFSKYFREAKNKIQEEWFPVYQTRQAREGSFIDKLGDGTWWASQGKTLGTSASLMLPSLGLAAVTGGAGLSTLGSAFVGALASRKAESFMEAQGNFEQEYNRLIQTGLSEDEAKNKAGQVAATTFKYNMAMLPVDILQFASGLKAFSGIKSAFDAGKRTTMGKILENAIIQPGSEALEEGYQFVVQQEALKQVQEGVTPFGTGFGDRLSEYIKDPEFQESAFMGAVTGGVFEGASRVARKAMNKIEANQTLKAFASNLKDFNSFQKVLNTEEGELIARGIKTNTIDKMTEQFSAYVNDFKQREDVSEEDKANADSRLQSFIENANYIKQVDETLKTSKSEYADNPNFRKQLALLNYEYKKNSEREDNYNSIINELQTKNFKDTKQNAVRLSVELNSYKNTLNKLKSDKKLSDKNKQNRIKELENTINSKSEELKGILEQTPEGFKLEEYGMPAGVVKEYATNFNEKINASLMKDIYSGELAEYDIKTPEQVKQAEEEIITEQVKNAQQQVVEGAEEILDNTQTPEETAEVLSDIEKSNIPENKKKSLRKKAKDKQVEQQVEQELQDYNVSREQQAVNTFMESIEEGYTIPITDTYEPISPEIYNEFVDTGNIDDAILNNITEKIAAGESLSQNEQSIAIDKVETINQKLREKPSIVQTKEIETSEINEPKLLTEEQYEKIENSTKESPAEEDIHKEKNKTVGRVSTVPNIAYKSKESKEDNKYQDKFDENGRVILNPEVNPEIFEQSKFEKGTKVFVSVEPSEIKDINEVPLVIKDKKGNPLGYIHEVKFYEERIKDGSLDKEIGNQLIEQTKRMRNNFLVDGKIDESLVFETTIVDKTPGWFNNNKNKWFSVEEAFKVGGKYPNDVYFRIINLKSRLDEIPAEIDIVNDNILKKSNLQGVPVAVVPSCSESKYLIRRLKQKQLKDSVQAPEIIHNALGAMIYALRNKSKVGISDLRSEVAKYIFPQTHDTKELKNKVSSINTKLLFNMEWFIPDNSISIAVTRLNKPGYDVYKLELLNNVPVVTLMTSVKGKKDLVEKGKVPIKDFENILFQSLNEKFINFHQDSAIEPAKFKRLVSNSDFSEIKYKSEDYRDYMSEYGILQSHIHGVETSNGKVVYATQPTLELSTDFKGENIKPEGKEETKTIIASTEGINFKIKDEQVDDFADFSFEKPLPKESKLTALNINYGKTKIGSFSKIPNVVYENDIINWATQRFIKHVNRLKGKEEEAFSEVISDFKRIKDAASKGEFSNNLKINQRIETAAGIFIDNFDTQLNSSMDVTFVGYKNRMIMELTKLKFDYLEDNYQANEEESSDQWSDSKNFKQDPEKSASARVKRALSSIELYEDGIQKLNLVGQSIYRDYYSTFITIMEATADIPIDQIYDELKALSIEVKEPNNVYEQVIKLLDESLKNGDDMYNNFMQVFTKQRVNMVTLLIKPKSETLKDGTKKQLLPTNSVIDANKSGTDSIITNIWKENYKKSDLFVADSEGNLRLKEGKLNEITKAINGLANLTTYDSYHKGLAEVLSMFGIIMSDKALDKFYSTFIKRPKTIRGFDTEGKGLKGYMAMNLSALTNLKNSLEKVEEADENDGLVVDIFKNQSGIIKGYARFEALVNPRAIANSFRNGNGDVIYGFVNKHHMASTIDDIKANRNVDILSDGFSSMATFNKTEEDLKALDLFYFDTAKLYRSKKDAVSYEDMSELEKEQTKIALTLGSAAKGKNLRTKVLTLTPSDKTAFSILQSLKTVIKKEDIEDITKFKLDVNSELVNKLFNLLVQSEINRIQETVTLFNQADKSGDWSNLIKGEHYEDVNDKRVLGSRGYFFLLPKMNKYLSGKLKHERLIKDGIHLTKDEVLKIKEKLVNELTRLAQRKYKQWDRIGAFDRMDTSYFNNTRTGVASMYNEEMHKKVYATLDFVINNAVSYANQLMLVTGDPATFAKPNEGWDGTIDTWEHMVDGTITNMFKRTAKDIAPGYEGRFESDEKNYNVVFINEPKRDSKLIQQLKDKLSEPTIKALSKIEFADAQEWTTLEEHVKVLAAVGKISKEQKDRVLNKYRNNEELNLAELGLILQPLKPVQVGRKHYGTDKGSFGVNYYIKTSSFPLIPQLTKGLDIDAVRVYMEENNISRMVPKSAVKNGFFKPISIVDESGKLLVKEGKLSPEGIVDNIDFHLHTLDRSFFRIQQDVPYKEDKREILEGSQMKKLKYSDLLESYDFKFRGKDVKGWRLKEIDDKIHIEIYRRQYNELGKKLNADKIKDQYRADNNVELKKLLIDEAIARDFDYNDIMVLEALYEGDTKFDNLPVFMHPALPKIEALLNSLIKNNVLVTKFPGKSYVQGSSMGFDFMVEGDKKLLSDIAKKTGINLVSDEKSIESFLENGLGYKEIDGHLEAEVLIPWYFKESIEPFINKNTGLVDSSKIDPKLLELIGYRIPTQDHGSIMKLKVVGFLPKASGDLLIVPPELSKIMGSDFDVDKLYVHRYNYNAENGRFNYLDPANKNVEELSIEELQNLSLEITHSILENKEITERLLSPLDNDDVTNVVNDIVKLTEESKTEDISKASTTALVSDELQSAYVDINAAGKTGIGIGSIASTSHVLAQYAGLYLKKTFDKKTGEEVFNSSVLFTDTKENKVKGESFTDHEKGIKVKQESVKKDVKHPNAVDLGLFRLDRVFGITGKRISQVIKNIQTEAVDNAKNQKLFTMNLNKNTFSTALFLAKIGLDEKYIGFFLNQPIIKEYINELNNISDIGSTDFEVNKKQTIQDKVYQKYEGKESPEITPKLISLEEMSEGLQGKSSNEFQRDILSSFLAYEEMAKAVDGLFKSINTDTKYLDKNVVSTLAKKKDFENNFEKDTIIGNKHNLENTLQYEAYKLGVEGSLVMFEKLLPYQSKMFESLLQKLQDNNNIENLNSDIIEDISKAVKASLWVNALANKNGVDIDEYRTQILFGNNSLANQLLKLQKTSKNLLVQILNANTSSKPEVPHTIEFTGAGNLEKDFSLKMQQSWLELYDNPTTKQFAIDLVGYAMSNGNVRNARDFSRFIPIDILESEGLINEINSEYNKIFADNFEFYSFLKQYYQHNPVRAYSIKLEEGVTLYDKEDKRTTKFEQADRITVDSKLVPDKNTFVYAYENNQQILFEKVEGNNYRKIPNLGSDRTYQLSEYNIANSEKSSIFAKKEDKVKTSVAPNVPEIKNVNPKDSSVTEKYGYNTENKLDIVIQNIADKSKNPAYSALAKLLIDNKKQVLNSVSLDIKDKHSVDENALGVYNNTNNSITLFKKNIVALKPDNLYGLPEGTIEDTFTLAVLHETIHSIANKELSNSNSDFTKAINKALEMWNSNKKEGEFEYYSTNNREFLAGLFTDKNFQNRLNMVTGNKKSLLQNIIEAIKKLVFGNIEVKSDSLLAEVLDASIEFISNKQPTEVEQLQELDFLTYVDETVSNNLKNKLVDEFTSNPKLIAELGVSESDINNMDLEQLGELSIKICK